MLDYPTFKRLVGAMAGIDLENYKSQQMDRRIHSLMQSWRLSTYDQFLEVLQTDTKKYQEFEKKLTINVSEFFRNPERFEELWRGILPKLARERWQIRIWSAGCSIGSEPYSVAIIARELLLDNRVEILATDVDKLILQQAEQGVYLANQVKNLPPEMIAKYFTVENNNYYLSPSIKSMVRFQHQNLLNDPFEPDLDLIICRNVVIYFTEAAKNALYQKFLEALRPGGYLLVGGTEPLLNYKQLGFETGPPSFYRKPEGIERSGTG